jgi:hypothetical protein
MFFHIIILWNWLMQSCRRWTRPISVSLAASSLTDLTRNRTDLITENAMLRQQLIVLRR